MNSKSAMESPEYLHGSSCWGENPQLALENKAGGGGGGGGGAGEQFAFEDLLNFSNEEDVEDGAVAIDGDDGTAGNSTDSSTVTAVDSCSNSSSSLEPHFPSDHARRSFVDAGLSDGFCEPQYEELAELEWLSNFVEESFSSEDHRNISLTSSVHSTTCTTAPAVRAEVSSEYSAGDRFHQPSHLQPSAQFPGKARSKRSRAAPCSWSSRLLVLSPSQAATSTPEPGLIIFPEDAAMFSSGKKAAKTTPKKRDASAEGRKCLHCQTDKTPQWRTGPMGPKTLCNACGVRFKSGRLVPEYRPAASPTFTVSKHSNSHRKVVELRRQKELQQQHQQLIHAGGTSASLYDVSPPMSSGAEEFLIHGSHLRHLL